MLKSSLSGQLRLRSFVKTSWATYKQASIEIKAELILTRQEIKRIKVSWPFTHTKQARFELEATPRKTTKLRECKQDLKSPKSRSSYRGKQQNKKENKFSK